MKKHLFFLIITNLILPLSGQKLSVELYRAVNNLNVDKVEQILTKSCSKDNINKSLKLINTKIKYFNKQSKFCKNKYIIGKRSSFMTLSGLSLIYMGQLLVCNCFNLDYIKQECNKQIANVQQLIQQDRIHSEEEAWIATKERSFKQLNLKTILGTITTLAGLYALYSGINQKHECASYAKALAIKSLLQSD